MVSPTQVLGAAYNKRIINVSQKKEEIEFWKEKKRRKSKTPERQINSVSGRGQMQWCCFSSLTSATPCTKCAAERCEVRT